MKKYYYSGCVLAIVGLLSACNDYLKEDSGDLLIPGKIEEYSPMLYAEGYPSSFNDDVAWFKLMTDDVEMGRLEIDSSDVEVVGRKIWDSFDALSGKEGKEAYSWRWNLGELLADNFWGKRYENILACNLVIDALPAMEYVEQDSGKYNYLAAQAYGLRAYHYWCLVNTYALPYAEANLDQPGVVIRTTPQIQITPRPRASIREVYKLINSDISLAEQYVNKSVVPGNKHLLTEPAILLLASRIALFQENWDEVVRTSELFLAQNSNVFDLNGVDTAIMGIVSNSKGFSMMDGMLNPEIVFTFGNQSVYYEYLSNNASGHMYGLGFRTSCSEENSLIKSYEENDLRKKAYFIQDVPAKPAESLWEDDKPAEYQYYYPVKYRRVSGSTAEKPNDKLYHENWRSVEVMLNVAEAYTRKENTVTQKAIDLLNKLRSKRISNYVDLQMSDFNSGEDLLHFIWDERRRELCFEEAMRFWDLRRQGRPQIVHKWYNSWNTYEVYTLPATSANYVLRIPESELKYNTECMDNTRENITANK